MTAMTIKDLKPGMIVRYQLVNDEAITISVSDIDRKGGQISGTTCRQGAMFGGRWESIQVRPTDELEVYSHGWARLYPGITKAEINVREVEADLLKVGYPQDKIKVEVREYLTHLIASISVHGKTMFHETYSASWMTHTGGRKTTVFLVGREYRGALRSKKYTRKSSVRLGLREFNRKIAWLMEETRIIAESS